MKLICVCLSFAILLTGCYSPTTITKDDTPNLDNVALTFYLTDGTYIRSKAGNHHRIENGYEVTGEHMSGQYYCKEISVVLRDDQIAKVVSKKIDVAKTVGLVGFGLLVVGVSVGLIVAAYRTPIFK